MKDIWILWLQGWDKAPWLQRQVLESWRVQNPGWNIHQVTYTNLPQYLDDVDYIYDKNKTISPQAMSDIIRISLLNKHGGVWADATMLCLQPLDNWVHEAVSHSGFWMYCNNTGGPASWFIVSEAHSYIIGEWKKACDVYWTEHNSTNNYYWMDALFNGLHERNNEFRAVWAKSFPKINCELPGQSHCLSHDRFRHNDPHLKDVFYKTPPFALKMWNVWNTMYPEDQLDTPECKASNGLFVIQLATKTLVQII